MALTIDWFWDSSRHIKHNPRNNVIKTTLKNIILKVYFGGAPKIKPFWGHPTDPMNRPNRRSSKNELAFPPNLNGD
jgi:hypothetical protein